MCPRPILLLELGASVPDDNSELLQSNLQLLKGKNGIEINPNDISSKLVILLAHFPTLRLLWSLESIYSVEYFAKLASLDIVGTPFENTFTNSLLFNDNEVDSEIEHNFEPLSHSVQVLYT